MALSCRLACPRWTVRSQVRAGWPGFAGRVGLIALLFATALVVAPPAARADGDAVVNTDVLNLRDGPGLDASIIDKMYDGDSVAILDGPTDDGWYEVSYGGEDGWAYGAYLNIGGSSGSDGSGGVGGDTGSSGGAEHWIDVNRSSQIVSLMVGGNVVDSFWGAMGYDGSSDGFFSTAIGTYSVYSMNASLTWTDWGQTYIEDWVGFDPDRDNGFHTYSMDADGNVLPWGDGPTGGCVALAPWAAQELYNFAYEGMRVEIHW